MTSGGDSLRIAFVADTIDDGYGGGVVSAQRFVEGLRQHHRVTVLATGTGGEDRVSLRALTVPVHAMRAMRFRFAVPNRKKMRMVFEQCDVVHLQFPFWCSFRAMKLAREMGLPVVAAFHVQPENLLRNVGCRAEWPARLLYRFWVERFYNRADVVVCPSQLARRTLLEAGLRRPTRVISNGVPREAFDCWPSPRKRAPDEPLTLLMVGRLAAEKRHDLVLEAIRLCRHRDQLRLRIAGAGPLEDDLRRRIQGDARVELLGYVSEERLAGLYRDADLLVHASEVELEGIVVLEAMARGLPVLVAEGSRSAASQFALSPDFRFRAGDARDLARRLDDLIGDPERLSASRISQVRRAMKFSVERSVSALAATYRAVCEGDMGEGRGASPMAAHGAQPGPDGRVLASGGPRPSG